MFSWTVRVNIVFKPYKLTHRVNLLIRRYRMICHISREDNLLGCPDWGLLTSVSRLLILSTVDFQMLIMSLVSRSGNRSLVHSLSAIPCSVSDHSCLVILLILPYGTGFWEPTIVHKSRYCWQVPVVTFDFVRRLFVTNCRCAQRNKR